MFFLIGWLLACLVFFISFFLVHLILIEELHECFWSTLKAYGVSDILRLQSFFLCYDGGEARSRTVLFSPSQS